MTGKPKERSGGDYRTDRFLAGRQTSAVGVKSGVSDPRLRHKLNRPFWLPASNYYVLSAAVSIAVFFLVWGVLLDGADEAPWIASGIAASIILAGAVVLREVFLRKARRRFLLTQSKLDANLKGIYSAVPQPLLPQNTSQISNKLTVEKNASIVKQIQQKSEAARLSGKLSEAHLEVAELCSDYLSLNRRQMETVGTGSPRLAALRRGREMVGQLHRYHLLTWAQNESRHLTQESKIRVKISDKLEAAQRALHTLQTAAGFYPNERQLAESETVLREFIASIKVSHWIEQAERAAFKGNYKRAINHYRDALFFLARDNSGLQAEKTSAVAERINAEIEKLRADSTKTINND